jgi:hypothetical protein
VNGWMGGAVPGVLVQRATSVSAGAPLDYSLYMILWLPPAAWRSSMQHRWQLAVVARAVRYLRSMRVKLVHRTSIAYISDKKHQIRYKTQATTPHTTTPSCVLHIAAISMHILQMPSRA